MPWTQSDVDNLKRAIADGRGARSITFENQTVVFHSVDEMLRLLAAMQTEASDEQAAAGTSARTRYAAYSKGT